MLNRNRMEICRLFDIKIMKNSQLIFFIYSDFNFTTFFTINFELKIKISSENFCHMILFANFIIKHHKKI